MPLRATFVVSDEPWKVYVDVTIDVAMLQEVHANEGSDSVAVVNYSKMWTMVGTFLADGDQVREHSPAHIIAIDRPPPEGLNTFVRAPSADELLRG